MMMINIRMTRGQPNKQQRPERPVAEESDDCAFAMPMIAIRKITMNIIGK